MFSYAIEQSEQMFDCYMEYSDNPLSIRLVKKTN